MERRISEPDWKLFRQLHPLALDRFCERVLAEVGRLAAADGTSSHERYLKVFTFLQEQDKELADTFNDVRRSTALVQLARMRFQDMVTEEELARFSPETRAAVQVFLGLGQD